MTEFIELGDDLDRATVKIIEFFPDQEDAANEYAKIAHGLTQQKELFHNALEQVSAMIWESFRNQQAAGNRFSRAIKEVAVNKFGFSDYVHTVFIAALGADEFVQRLQNAVLFKDSFGGGHGEFTHSFQWMGLGQLFGWEQMTARLYAGTGAKSAVPLFHVASGGITANDDARLWEFLVDSVPPKVWMDDPEGYDKNALNYCFTQDSYRYANNLQSMLETKQDDWFVGYWAARRTAKIETLKEQTFAKYRGDGSKGDAKRAIMERIGKLNKPAGAYRDLDVRQAAAKDKYARRVDNGVGHFNEGQSVFEISFEDIGAIEFTEQEIEARQVVEMEFHGQKGLVPLNQLEV